MGCVQSYFRKAHNAGLSPSSTHGSEKGGIPQDATADVADLVDHPEKEPLDINDIQNEDEVIQTEKLNESAPEPNGTIKTDDSNVTKVIAATGTAAVAGAVTAAVAGAGDNSESKENIEDTRVNELTESPKPSDDETATEVPQDAKTRESLDDDVVIIETDSAAEVEENHSASIPELEESARAETVAQPTEVAPSESVPGERPSTAKSEESKEQGSTSASASDIVIEGKADSSRPTSIVPEEAEGTRTSSASETKTDSVPDEKEEPSRPQSGVAINSPAQQETQQNSRPVSVSESVKSTGRPESSTSPVDSQDRPASSIKESSGSNSTVERQVESESRPGSNEEISRPVSVTDVLSKSRPVSAVESVKEVESIPGSSEVEKSTENKIVSAVNEERPASVAETLQTPSESRPSSTSESTKANVAVETQVVDGLDTTKQESRPESAKENPELIEKESESERPISATETINEEGSRPISKIEAAQDSQSRPASKTDSASGDFRSPNAVVENEIEQDNVSGSRPISTVGSTKEEVSRPTSVEGKDAEDSTSQPVSVTGSTKEETSRPASAVVDTDKEEISGETACRPVSVAESTKEEGSRPASTVVENVQLSEKTTDSRPASISESTKDGSRPVSVTESAKEEGSRPTSAIVNSEIAEDKSSRPESVAESTKEDSRPASTMVDATDVNEELENVRPASIIEPTKEEILDATESEEQQLSNRPVSVAESTKGESLPGSVIEPPEEVNRSTSVTESTGGEESQLPSNVTDVCESVDQQASSRPVSVAESTKDAGSRPVSVAESTKDAGSRPASVTESTKDAGSRPASIAESTKDAGSRPVSIAESTKDAGSRPVSIAEFTKDAESRPVSVAESTKDAGSRPVSVAESTEDARSRPVSVAESTKDAGSQPVSVAAESVKDNESRPVSVVESPKDTGSQPVSVAESAKDAGSRPVSVVESTKDAGSRPVSVTESTKGDGNGPEVDTDKVNEQQITSRPTSSAESTKEEGSRPESALIDRIEVVEQVSSGALSAADVAQESISRPTSSAQENVALEKQDSSRPASVSESTKDIGSRPASTIVDTTEDAKVQNEAESMKDETSRPSSSAIDTEAVMEAKEDRPTSAAESNKEDRVTVLNEDQKDNAENLTRQLDNRPVSVEDSKIGGSRPVSVVTLEEQMKTVAATEGQEPSKDEIKEFVDSEVEQVPPEPKTEETSSTRPPSSVAVEQEESKQPSRPASLTQEEAEDGRSTAEARNESSAGTAAQPIEAEAEVSEISEDERKLEDEEPTATLEDTAEPESSQILSGSVPSLTVTEVADEPRSDDEVEVQAEEEAKPAEGPVEEEPVAKDEKEILNTAATTIQATFRGFQTRQALSKSADVPQVQQETSHDFLFGPPVNEATPTASEAEPVNESPSVTSTPRSPETGEKQPDVENELAELQKPQECDDLPPPPEDIDMESDIDSSVSTAATKIQAGVRGFLTRRQVQQMKTSNSTTAPSMGDSMPSVGDTLTSQEEDEDDGVQTSGSLETEVQKQHQVTTEEDEITPQEHTTEVNEIPKGRSLDSQLNETTPKNTPVRSAVSLHDGPVNEEEDREVWQTLQQDVLDNAATKIQSNFRGYRTRRSLKREDAVQIPTTSTSTATASTEVVPEPIRHSGEFHDMMVLPPSPQEDSTDASTSVSGPIQ